MPRRGGSPGDEDSALPVRPGDRGARDPGRHRDALRPHPRTHPPDREEGARAVPWYRRRARRRAAGLTGGRGDEDGAEGRGAHGAQGARGAGARDGRLEGRRSEGSRTRGGDGLPSRFRGPRAEGALGRRDPAGAFRNRGSEDDCGWRSGRAGAERAPAPRSGSRDRGAGAGTGAEARPAGLRRGVVPAAAGPARRRAAGIRPPSQTGPRRGLGAGAPPPPAGARRLRDARDAALRARPSRSRMN